MIEKEQTLPSKQAIREIQATQSCLNESEDCRANLDGDHFHNLKCKKVAGNRQNGFTKSKCFLTNLTAIPERQIDSVEEESCKCSVT